MAALPDSVRRFELELALSGGPDGLKFYRAIVKNYLPVLKPGGFLCLEFGMGQEDEVGRILERGGCEVVKFQEDARGITRAVMAQKKGEENGIEETGL